ncbi:MAG: hypothetical protein H7061_04230 [Bdellovibrionaceae bacterium]|nr:hypothetical protein [Bdellovibrio sp.]
MNHFLFVTLLTFLTASISQGADSIIGKWKIDEKKACSSGAPYVTEVDPRIHLNYTGVIMFGENSKMEAKLHILMSADKSFTDEKLGALNKFKKQINNLSDGPEKTKATEKHEVIKNMVAVYIKGLDCDSTISGTYQLVGNQLTTQGATTESTCGAIQNEVSGETHLIELSASALKMTRVLTPETNKYCPPGDNEISMATRIQ